MVTAVRKVGGGNPRKATAVNGRYIVPQAKRIQYHWRSLSLGGDPAPSASVLLDQTSFLWMSMHRPTGLLISSSCEVTQMDWPAFSPDLNPIERVGCFEETLCSMIISFEEHSTTETDVDLGMGTLFLKNCQTIWY
ncbi:hypothetical protein TNCV_2409941 [Trichonephila clavipes]|nr:hypothetical protein TNCV_2409941 [Trichonephila clavipes]